MPTAAFPFSCRSTFFGSEFVVARIQHAQNTSNGRNKHPPPEFRRTPCLSCLIDDGSRLLGGYRPTPFSFGRSFRVNVFWAARFFGCRQNLGVQKKKNRFFLGSPPDFFGFFDFWAPCGAFPISDAEIGRGRARKSERLSSLVDRAGGGAFYRKTPEWPFGFLGVGSFRRPEDVGTSN